MTETAVPPPAEARVAIVCPMANEEASAESFVGQVLAAAEGFQAGRFFAILDGASRDGTRALLLAMAKLEPRLSVVWAPENRNVVDAYKRGYREGLATGFDWILEIDAGFSHQPEDLRHFLAPMGEGYDCIFGTRFAKGGRISDSSLVRRMVSRGGTWLANLLLGTRLSDMTSGYQMFRPDALETILARGVHATGHFFQTEMKFHARDMRVAEVPIHYKTASNSLGSGAVFDALIRLFALFRQRFAPAKR